MSVDPLDISLCTPEDVQAAYGQGGLTYNQDIIDSFVAQINLFSSSMEGPKFLNQKIKKTTYTEYYDSFYDSPFRKRKKIIIETPPIIQDLEVFVDPEKEFPAESQWEEDTDYQVDLGSGIITPLSDWGCYRKNIKVRYLGGLVLYDSGTDTLDAPEDLRRACALQVSHWYKIRNEPGAMQFSTPGGGSIRLYEPTQILPHVWATIQGYKRVVF